MTQNNTLNVKLSNLKLIKLKSEIKNDVGDSNDENNFRHILLSTNT